MDNYEKMHKVAKLNKEYKEGSEERGANNDRNNLIRLVRKRMVSIMIRALAEFEEGFGALWGHKASSKTDNEKAWSKLWERVRTSILDYGNNQIWMSESELQNFTITRDKLEVRFIKKEQDSAKQD